MICGLQCYITNFYIRIINKLLGLIQKQQKLSGEKWNQTLTLLAVQGPGPGRTSKFLLLFSQVLQRGTQDADSASLNSPRAKEEKAMSL